MRSRAQGLRQSAGSLLRVALLGGAAVFLVSAGPSAGQPAAAGTAAGSSATVEVTVTPTSGVTDGQALSIHVTAPSGTVIYEIAAHLCLPGSAVEDSYNFSFLGDFCTKTAVGTGDTEQIASFPIGTRSGDLDTFRVGVGSTMWVTDRGYPHNISCGPGSPCDVVVQVQITNDTVFYTAPLCFGSGCPVEPPPADGPPPAAAGATSGAASSQTPNEAAGAAQAPQTPASSSPSTQSSKVPGTTKPPLVVANGGSSSSGKGDDDVAAAQTGSATVVPASADGLSRSVRVFLAAVLGALGAARILYVLSRARRSANEMGTP